jgi:hypothetical protein
VSGEVVGGHPHHSLLFLQRHGLLGIAKIAGLPGLHLDEHEIVSMARDDIEHARSRALTPCNDGISARRECIAGQVLAEQPVVLSRVGHGTERRNLRSVPKFQGSRVPRFQSSLEGSSASPSDSRQ